ncbi:hypothetical protein SAMN02745196_00818 [Clostridium collagenovorans DSM 3089]|uniref:Uncharacterized protein n=1 Tax=Clostridium collagenovorans DSM 3089 TaxID=1121306 RepID=A0A1M5U3A6_9CLOT|nr:hypothetical protein [Clostridium collagenovorans]SHH57163.1 hypothetical protein SAMN02745196_00818 [Clostridium collagenovorans DSM 3089]
MKQKKVLAGIAALFICSAMLIPIQVHATEQSEGATTITTTVPDTHTVLLDIGEHGSVKINDKTYTSKDSSAEIARLGEQRYIIQSDKGWQIDNVRYGSEGQQEMINLRDNAFTAPAITSNNNRLIVSLKKAPTTSGTGNGSSSQNSQINTSVQTGDTARITLWSMIAMFICPGIVGTFAVRYRKER